ncbi:hypothetical protein N7475_000807 [Penicillium sp. IBT 31633x]|nr:hypothetical protein N7475_000807 [Penicillium sp. IBT 31633x]
MAPQTPATPKSPTTPKSAKKTKDGVTKRTPAKGTPSKATTESVAQKELIFLWTCITHSGGITLNVPAVAKELGVPNAAISKKFWRLKKKLEDMRPSEIAGEEQENLDDDLEQ